METNTGIPLMPRVVLLLLGMGLTREEVCHCLKISKTTISDYLCAAYKKLGTRELRGAFAAITGTKIPPRLVGSMLSPRELQTLNLIKVGLPAKEIAKMQNSSEQTVKNFLTRLYSKLGILGCGRDSRTVAVVIAHKMGLIDFSDVDVAAIQRESVMGQFDAVAQEAFSSQETVKERR